MAYYSDVAAACIPSSSHCERPPAMGGQRPIFLWLLATTGRSREACGGATGRCACVEPSVFPFLN